MSVNQLEDHISFAPVEVDPDRTARGRQGVHPDFHHIVDVALMAQERPNSVPLLQLRAGIGALAVVRGVSMFRAGINGEVSPGFAGGLDGLETTFTMDTVPEAQGVWLAQQNLLPAAGRVSAIAASMLQRKKYSAANRTYDWQPPSSVSIGFDLAGGTGRYTGFFVHLGIDYDPSKRLHILSGASALLRAHSMPEPRGMWGFDTMSAAGAALQRFMTAR